MLNKTSPEEDTEETAKYFINDRHSISCRKIWSTMSKTSVSSFKMGSGKGHWMLCSKVQPQRAQFSNTLSLGIMATNAWIKNNQPSVQRHLIVVVVVQLPSHVQLSVTPWTVACQASLSFTISRSLLKLVSIESYPLSSPSPPGFNLSQNQGLFQSVSSSHQVAKVLELQHQSFQ